MQPGLLYCMNMNVLNMVTSHPSKTHTVILQLEATHEGYVHASAIVLSLAGVSIAGCSKFPLTEEDMKPDKLASRMLMYNPWNNEKEIYVMKRVSALSGPQ